VIRENLTSMEAHLSTYQYGSPRQPNEGLRLGVARHVPRGVRREDWQRKNYFDLWLPLVAPTSDLVSQYKHGRTTFKVFSRHYRAQMKTAESRQVIELLASVAMFQPANQHRLFLRGRIPLSSVSFA